MANELEARIIVDCVEDIASKLGEAAIIAKTAHGLNAFRTLLGIEILITDATALLNKTSIVRRREREDVADLD